MAYQVRGRDPLFDSETQALIERRGAELLGLALLALALIVALVLGSYRPADPSWLNASDAAPHNVLGRFGASLASPLVIIAGLGGWAIGAILAGWGLRLVTHRGAGRILGRAVLAPIAVALVCVFASTHVPPQCWGHSFGLGGLFGDMVLGALLGVIPVGAAAGLKLMSAALALAALWAMLAALGFTRDELRLAGAFVLRGLIVAYDAALGFGGAAARRTGVGAAGLRSALRERRERRRSAPPEEQEPSWEDEIGLTPGFFDRLKRPFRRGAGAQDPPDFDDAPDADPLSARIADLVRSRTRPPILLPRSEPTIGRGPAPFDSVEDDADDDPVPEIVGADDRAAAGFAPAGPRKVRPPPKAPAPSRKAWAEAQPVLPLEPGEGGWEHPPLNLLTSPERVTRHHLSEEALEENARMLENVLDDYGVKGEIVSVRPGPVVTMYELEPAPGLKASRVIGLADDIARSMSALSARVSTVPGRSVIGIELPNVNRERVILREILSARDYGDTRHQLPLALGKDIGGSPVVVNLAKMPHLLIAGTTGSGKSVAINTMILSLLYKLSPEECRLIMIDPKMLELSVYDGIPHLLSPVVTDPKKAVVALKWVVAEMEERYRKMSKMGVRNIDGYNSRVADALAKGEMFSRTAQTGFDDDTGEPVFETEEFEPEAMPYIVVVVDEMADLMMVAGKEIEACIQRLAQMARASGIHLIMATQRPSVDVITGTIKANFPTRISFQVTSKVDSRTILGEMGAEQLLGQGDMLHMAGGSKINRVHGPFVSDEEVEEIVRWLKALGEPDYVESVLEGPDEGRDGDIDAVLGLGGNTDADASLYDQAVAIVARDRKCSTSYIQRKLAIGYNKAARLVEQMEDQGVVGPANQVGKREILVPEA